MYQKANDTATSSTSPLPCWTLLPSAAWYNVGLWLKRSSLQSFMLSCKPCSQALRPAPKFQAAWLDHLKHVFPTDPVLEEREMSMPQGTSALALTHDGGKAITSMHKTIYVWDLVEGRTAATLRGHTQSVRALAVSPIEPLAVSGDAGGRMLIWDVDVGLVRAELTGHTDAMCSVKITPCGKRAVSCSKDKTLRVWDLQAGTCTATLEGHEGPVVQVQLSRDGRCAMSLADNDSCRVWDLARLDCTAVIRPGGQAPVWALLCDDGKVLITVVGFNLEVWDVTQVACVRRRTYENVMLSPKLLPNGREVVAGTVHGVLGVWNLYTGEYRLERTGHQYGVMHLARQPQTGPGSQASFVTGTFGEPELRGWSVGQDGSWRCAAVLKGHRAGIQCVAMSHGGRYALSLDHNGKLRVWDLGARGVW